MGLQTPSFQIGISAKKMVRSASGEVIGTVFYFALIVIVQFQSPQVAGANLGCPAERQVQFFFSYCLAVVSK
jgi:hypothetical protein